MNKMIHTNFTKAFCVDHDNGSKYNYYRSFTHYFELYL